jgi:hypothetical protein
MRQVNVGVGSRGVFYVGERIDLRVSRSMVVLSVPQEVGGWGERGLRSSRVAASTEAPSPLPPAALSRKISRASPLACWRVHQVPLRAIVHTCPLSTHM